MDKTEMMNHTKEPWYAIQNPIWGNADYRISNKENDEWGSFGQIAYASEFDAKRIVACVNACAGITTEALENGLISQLEAKAEAYDKMMSMNSISENDIQIVLDGNAWCAYRLPFRNLQEDDAGFGDTPQIALTALLESELPDGWEER